MQTPISFILDLLLDEKEQLPPAMQKRCKRYIKELEQGVEPPKIYLPRDGRTMQAPSTQRILDEMALETGAALPQAVIPKIPTAQRIQGGEVNTGNGTKGPRKW